jgi:hypothetical protein
MHISDDRWTCPECEKTFVSDSSGSKGRLAAVQAAHALKHADVPTEGHVWHKGVIGSGPPPGDCR